LSFPFGSWGRGGILTFMFILSYGCMIAYLLIIKETLPKVLGYTSEDYENTAGPEIVLIFVSSLIILPISMQRDISSLEKTSIISIGCDIILIIFIATRSPISQTIEQYGGFGEVWNDYAFNFNRMFIGLGIISTAMGCQQSVFMIYGSLENPTRKRFYYVTVIALTMSTLLSVFIGTCGSLAFMEDTKGNILNNYHSGSGEANIARLLLAITMIFTYPMESFIVRHVIVDLFYDGDMDGSHPPTADADDKRTYWLNRREKVTLISYIMALLPALVFDDTGIVLSLTGAIAGSVLAYIGPGLAYIGINGNSFLEICCRFLGYHKKQKQEHDVNEEATDDDDSRIELPMIGNSSLKMNEKQPTTEEYYTFINSSCCKPIWWYLFGFPLWSSIAYIGSTGMKQQSDNESSMDESNSSILSESTAHDDIPTSELEIPRTRDFVIATFFIIFGAVAFVLGIAENVHKALLQRDNPDFDTTFDG